MYPRRAMLGDALDDLSTDPIDNAANDPLLQRLHQLALLIVTERGVANDLLNQISNADAPDNIVQLFTAETQMIADAVTEFRAVAAQRAAVNPYALGNVDSAILAIGDWAQGVLNVLPATISAIPNALLDALARILQQAGKTTASALVWPAVIVGAGLLLVLQAEKSRTYKRYVA